MKFVLDWGRHWGDNHKKTFLQEVASMKIKFELFIWWKQWIIVRFGQCDEIKRKRISSPTGNWTPVSRVTGGDTDHYTIEEYLNVTWKAISNTLRFVTDPHQGGSEIFPNHSSPQVFLLNKRKLRETDYFEQFDIKIHFGESIWIKYA